MSSYTMELRNYIEMWSQDETLPVRERIEKGRKHLFDFDYPIFNEDYRKVFETNFIRKFYMREIGFETEGLFKFQLETWLLHHMPYFNKLYESQIIEFDPLINSKISTTYNRTKDQLQNDVRDAKQNTLMDETSNTIQNQTTATNGKSDATGTSNTTDHATNIGEVDSSGTSTTTGKNDTVSSTDENKHETSSTDKTGTKIADDFKRDIGSNTPDQRLALTANDGESVIEYANRIDEENKNGRENTTENAGSERTAVNGIDSTDSTTSTATTTSSDLANTTNTTDGTTQTNTTNGLIDSSDSTTDATGNTVNKGIGETTQNDKLVSNINNVEDFIETRVGKVGTQTYSEMIMKYRETLINVEEEIFNKMNELFMLVY